MDDYECNEDGIHGRIEGAAGERGDGNRNQCGRDEPSVSVSKVIRASPEGLSCRSKVQ